MKLVGLIVIAMLMLGCSSKSHLENAKLTKITLTDLVKECSNVSFKGNNLLLKRCDFTFDLNGKVQNLTGSVFVNIDSSIIVSFQALLGIEVARLKITPSTVTIVDRFHKQVIVSNYSYFSDLYAKGLSYLSLQAILCNRLYCLQNQLDSTFTDESYKVSYLADGYCISSVEDKRFLWLENPVYKPFIQVFVINPTKFSLIKSIISKSDLSSSVSVTYSSFLDMSGFLFPTIIEIVGSTSIDKFSFILTSSNIQVNTSNPLNFSIPDGYETVVK